ncbi:MAG TPA: S8 family serine peptidase [Gemmatimonadaceae bacterium]|nr:S8 family serine peptidase [Gemmatimonadaceae bacterium]
MKPDLVAPGVGILAAGSTSRGAKPGSGGLVRMSGTSMAAPHVAGTVALMLGAAPRPLRIEETRALLLGACRPMDDADPLRVGAGMLDVSAAVRAAESVRPVNTRVEEQEGEAMDETTIGTLASEVEAVLERGWTLTDEAAVLGELLGDDTGDGLSPDALFEGLTTGVPRPPDRIEVLAFPGQYLTSELRPGDVLLRVARGERGLGHVAVLTDGELLAASTLNALGAFAEGSLVGRYARVIEGGAAPHSIDDLATRRITGRDGCVPYDQMIVRILPNESSELDIEELDVIDDEDIDDADSEATDAAASAALGRQLRARAPNGVAVAVYLAGDQLFKTEALAWAAREDALGMGPKATSIVAPQLRLGKPIPDTGDLAKLTRDLGSAMDEALAIDPAGPVTGPFPQSSQAVIRALALFTHGSVTGVSICGGVDTTNVPPVVKDIAPRLTNDVRIMIYGCSVARGQGEKEDWYTTTFTRGGADSLAGVVRDALIDEGKSKAEVWGHTEVGHAVNNFTLRRFAAGDGKGSDGVPFAGEIVFRATEHTAALQEVRAAVLASGVVIQDATAFDAAASKAIVSEMYKAYRDAQLTVTSDKKELNNRTLQGENLAEMAPFYTEEVAVIIRDYWTATHWTEALRKKLAGSLVKTLKLTKAPVTTPSPSPTPSPSRTPTPRLTPREDVEDMPSADWVDDADTPEDDARATAALGEQIRKRAPNGVAVAIFGTDESRFRGDATKWAAREEALGVVEGRRKKLVAHQMSLGRPIPCTGKLEDIVNAVGRAIESAVSIDPITLSPLPIVFGPETRIRALALFTHGDIDWVGACQQIRNGDLGRVVKAMSQRLAPDIRVMIYGCQGARDADEPTPAWRRNSMRRGGSSSFCALFRDALLAEGKHNAEVWGHTESGSPTRNFSLRRFRAADGKGADGVPFAGEIVFGPAERKLARDQVEGHVIGLGLDISGATLAALHNRADKVVEAQMYESYSEQTKVDTVNGEKVRSDRLTLRGASLGEMAPFYPDEVTAILREYWTNTFWTMEQQRKAAKQVADGLHLKKSRAPRQSATPTPVPVGP